MSDVPDFPINIVAVAAPTSANITWDPPTDTGESSITGYTVVSTPGNKTISVGPDVNTYTMTGLTNGIPYRFQVFAQTEIGMSGISNAVTPYPPPRVTKFTSTATIHTLTLRWVGIPGAGPSPITSYTITCSDTNVVIPPVSLIGNNGTCVITEGLTAGTAINFSIFASSAILDSSTITLTGVIPLTYPDPPSELTAVAKAGSAILTWLPGSFDGGTAVTEYIISYDGMTVAPAAIPMVTLRAVSGNARSLTVSKLVNGNSYMFYIRAKTKAGISQTFTSSATITPYGLPGAPVLTVVPGDSQATLSWTARLAHEESPITSYTITCTNPAVTIPSPNITSAIAGNVIVTGLTNGTLYTFRINSVSEMGSSAVVSKAILVAALPDSPTNLIATRGSTSAVLSWTAPNSNGGAAITSYVITSIPATTTITLATKILPTTVTVTKLRNGTEYTFYIVARNSTGTSVTPTESNAVTPATVPAAPRVTGASLSQSIRLSWPDPVNNGSAITSYTVTSIPSSTIPSDITSSPVTIEGLTPGAGYVFTVIAVNSVGNSLPGRSASIRPTA